MNHFHYYLCRRLGGGMEIKMSGDSIITFAMFALLAYGFWSGWKQLSNGSGFLGGLLPQKALVYLNCKQFVPVILKIGISLVISYIIAAITILTLILKLIGLIVGR